ncbi:dolichyl-diphosphooligosaccharide-protein glycosyltransferase 48kD subunit, partial [Thraustotheca clavata]
QDIGNHELRVSVDNLLLNDIPTTPPPPPPAPEPAISAQHEERLTNALSKINAELNMIQSNMETVRESTKAIDAKLTETDVIPVIPGPSDSTREGFVSFLKANSFELNPDAAKMENGWAAVQSTVTGKMKSIPIYSYHAKNWTDILFSILACSFLSKSTPEQFTWNQKFRSITSIVRGLQYLHSFQPPIIHRDLKSRNVLLDTNKGTKLTDFGESREMDLSTLTNGVGTYQWMASWERIIHHCGVGVILSEFSTHNAPYADFINPSTNQPYNQRYVMNQVSTVKIQPSFDANQTPEWGIPRVVQMMFRLSLLLVSLALCVTATVRTAIFLDEGNDGKQYSAFFEQLSERGHELSYFTEKSNEFALKHYGSALFENVVILSPSLKTLGASALGKDALLSFVEEGGNVIVGGSLRLSKMLRQFALESGVEFDKKGTIVMDHINHLEDPSDTYHSLIKTTKWINSPLVVGKDVVTDKKPIVYNGIGMTLEPSNILGFTILSAEPTAYSAAPTKEIRESHEVVIGTNVGLVTAIQARNNARLIFTGSLDLFDNTYVTSGKYGNGPFLKAVAAWGLNESGVLKVSNIHHAREDGSLPDKMLSDAQRPDQPLTLYPDAEVARDSLVYRIKDNLTYSFDITELKNGKWVPFAADDVQLEFVMLDPHVRKTMSHNKKGHFSVTFTAPDVYGIFQFRVMYRRVGYTTLHFTTQVSLRPYKHDEYERFIPAAFPYYASAFSMIQCNPLPFLLSSSFISIFKCIIIPLLNMHKSDDEEEPRSPLQHPAPMHPRAKLPSIRLDKDFLNTDRALHYAHIAQEAPIPNVTMNSTKRLEQEIDRVQKSKIAVDVEQLELDADEKRGLLKENYTKDETRYNYEALVDVQPSMPIKPRKVKKQLNDKWKASMAIAPRSELPQGINFNLENRVYMKDFPSREFTFDALTHMASIPLESVKMDLYLK